MPARASGALLLVASSWVAAQRAGGRSLRLRFVHGHEREGAAQWVLVPVLQLLPLLVRSAGQYRAPRPYEIREILRPPIGDDRHSQFSTQRGLTDQKASDTGLHRRNAQAA